MALKSVVLPELGLPARAIVIVLLLISPSFIMYDHLHIVSRAEQCE
jgi:hypothetical protein